MGLSRYIAFFIFINKYYPGNTKSLANLEEVRVSKIKDVDSLLVILDAFDPIVTKDIAQIEEVLAKKEDMN